MPGATYILTMHECMQHWNSWKPALFRWRGPLFLSRRDTGAVKVRRNPPQTRFPMHDRFHLNDSCGAQSKRFKYMCSSFKAGKCQLGFWGLKWLYYTIINRVNYIYPHQFKYSHFVFPDYETVAIGRRPSNAISQSAPRQHSGLSHWSPRPSGGGRREVVVRARRSAAELKWSAHARRRLTPRSAVRLRKRLRAAEAEGCSRRMKGLRPCGGSRSPCCPAPSPSCCTCGWRSDPPTRRRTTTHTRVLSTEMPRNFFPFLFNVGTERRDNFGVCCVLLVCVGRGWSEWASVLGEKWREGDSSEGLGVDGTV